MRNLLIHLDGKYDRSQLREYLAGIIADGYDIVRDGAVIQDGSMLEELLEEYLKAIARSALLIPS